MNMRHDVILATGMDSSNGFASFPYWHHAAAQTPRAASGWLDDMDGSDAFVFGAAA